jgi:hypothetical protein
MDLTSIPPLKLNGLTGAPLLRLLLATYGEEPGTMTPTVAWNAFKQFVRLKSDSSHDLVSFQATWAPEDETDYPDEPLYFITWSRELIVPARRRAPRLPAFASWVRAIQVQWKRDGAPVDADPDVEVWSDKYEDLDAFLAAVESLPHFSTLMGEEMAVVELYTVDQVE